MLIDKVQETSPGSEFDGVPGSSDFPEHMTPLMLAAQCGHYEIIGKLLERGHPPIKKPHKPACRCEKCRQRDKEDLLYTATKR